MQRSLEYICLDSIKHLFTGLMCMALCPQAAATVLQRQISCKHSNHPKSVFVLDFIFEEKKKHLFYEVARSPKHLLGNRLSMKCISNGRRVDQS